MGGAGPPGNLAKSHPSKLGWGTRRESLRDSRNSREKDVPPCGGIPVNPCGVQRLIRPTRAKPSSFFLTVVWLLWLATSIFFALQVPPFSSVKKNR